MTFVPGVVAALIEKDGRYFICKRPLNKAQGGAFEFPGGKIEPGETHQEALVRECREELQIAIAVGDLFLSWSDESTDQLLPIHFYFARILSGTPVLSEHTEGFFAYPAQMDAFVFPKSDLAVIKALQELPSSPKPSFYHCVWDFDGTLFNSYPQIHKAMNLALQSLGIQEDPQLLLQLLKRSVGRAVNTMKEKHHLTVDLFDLYRRIEADFPIGDLKPYPGIPQLLRDLHQAGAKHYVYTHRGDSTLAYLKENNLDSFFSHVITKKANFPHKPAPDALHWLLNTYHIPQNQAIMIGDRSIDVYAGFNAGIEGCFLDLDHFFSDDQIPKDISLRFHTIQSFSNFLWGIHPPS